MKWAKQWVGIGLLVLGCSAVLTTIAVGVPFPAQPLNNEFLHPIPMVAQQGAHDASTGVRNSVWWTVCAIAIIDVGYGTWFMRNQRRSHWRKM